MAILLLDSYSKMPTGFTALYFLKYIVLYFKLCLCLLYVAYFLGVSLFMSFSVCCGMTPGAAVCHASY